MTLIKACKALTLPQQVQSSDADLYYPRESAAINLFALAPSFRCSKTMGAATESRPLQISNANFCG